jgi:flagellar biosynthesis/type III secretory pathway protein FliH
MMKPIRQFAMVFAALLFMAGVVAAQDYYGAAEKSKEHGYQHGYREGLRNGRADLVRNAPHNLDSEEFRRADMGYDSRFGERDDFQEGFRNGYKDGYDDGYYNKPIRQNIYGLNDSYDPDRVPRTDADAPRYQNWTYEDVAMDTGYRDGMQAGLSDLRQHKDFKPEKHEAYEDAKHGYRTEYGDKKLFVEQYRKGFLRGYEDATNRKYQR